MLGLEPQGTATETQILRDNSEEVWRKQSAMAEIFAVYCGSDGKKSACSVGVPGSSPQLGGSPGEGNGYPLQYSCLENSMDRGAWQATVPGVAKSQTWLSDFHFHPAFPTHLPKRLPLLHCIFLPPTLIDHRSVGLFLGSLFYCSICLFFVPIPCCFWLL